MHLVSLNIAQVQTVQHNGKPVRTGIFKVPVEGPRAVAALGIDGDEQADLKHHGGEDKAVYGYPAEHYPTWAAELGQDYFPPGQFGENLTTTGLLEDRVCIGDIYRIGGVALQVTQPRVPCAKLAMKMGLPTFLKTFLASGRSGFYFRVLEPGTLQAGDDITLEEPGPGAVTVLRANRLRHFETGDRDGIEAVLAVPALSATWRAEFERLLG